jgi:hypothetical protein
VSNVSLDGGLIMALSFFDEVIVYAIETLQRWGWTIVFVLLILYFSQGYLEQAGNAWSLRNANEPNRVQLLDEERRRVRLQQQIELQRKNNDKNQSQK